MVVAQEEVNAIDPLGLWVFYFGGNASMFGGPFAMSGGGGFVIDSCGNFGFYEVYGLGGGMGGSTSFGASFGFFGSTNKSAPTTTINDFAGPFMNGSVGAGFGAYGSWDGFYDPWKPENIGGGFTFGEGVGGGFSWQATNTTVTPSNGKPCSCE